ncbi:RHS Repeat family protein, partial [Shigella sonnei]|nr:RHS Repeat family protein [Shigella sonnei]
MAGTTASVCRVADARPGIPGEFTCRAAGALWLDA